MKKLLFTIVTILSCILLLCSCAAEAPMANDSAYEYYTDAEAEAEEPAVEELFTEGSSTGLGNLGGNIITDSDRKLIYTASYCIDTENYEADYNKLVSTAAKYNGYVSSENTYGTPPEEYGDSGRTSDITLKIPVENYTKFTSELSGIGYITSKYQNVDEITSEYMDTESRITLLETRYEKLDEHLKQATKMEDIITLEEEMTQILYELETLKGEKRGYDKLLAYSTIDISLCEVVEITEVPASKEGFWQRAGKGFADTMAGVGNFFEGIGVFLISALPVLLVLAALAVIAILIIKAGKKRRAKQAEELKKYEESKTIDIARISLTEDGTLNIYPGDREFPQIYRSAMGTYWDDEKKCLYPLGGQDMTVEQVYVRMLKAVKAEYDCRLLISPDTEWQNAAEDIKNKLIGAEQYVYANK